MSEKCIVGQCGRTSRASCKCCQQNLCLEHFLQHNDFIISQLNTLEKEVNEVDDRLKALNIEESKINFHQQAKQWRIDTYATIDRFVEEKCHEFDRYTNEKVEKQREDINQLQKQINEYIEVEGGNQEKIDSIKSNINDINEKVGKMEETLFPITISPLILNKNLIQFDV